MDATETDKRIGTSAHRLMIGDRLSPWRATPNLGRTMRPEIIVLHETAGRLDPDSAIAWLCNPAAKASAHLVVDRAGRVTQLAAFNRVAWHAGVSQYKARKGVNAFSIGIELVGPGKLTHLGAGRASAWFGEQYSQGEHRIQPAKTAEHGAGWWMPFTDAQIAATIAICHALVEAYSLKDITTHWAISPKRKVDPNPLFPLQRCREAAFGNNAPPMGGA
jgi:N-acetylmuramoyl-L-alanine amidase